MKLTIQLDDAIHNWGSKIEGDHNIKQQLVMLDAESPLMDHSENFSVMDQEIFSRVGVLLLYAVADLVEKIILLVLNFDGGDNSKLIKQEVH